MPTPPDATLYVGQKAFVRDGERVLILNAPGYGLDFPGGRLQLGEIDLAAALQREVTEETGLAVIVGAPFVTWIDEGHPATKATGHAVILIGYDCRLAGSADVRLSHEHDAWRWITAADLPAVQDGSPYGAALATWFALPTSPR